MGGKGKGQEHGADVNAAALQNLGGQYSANQQQLYNTLFGGGAGAGGNSGVLNQFLNPASLNVTSPTGVYGLQYSNAKNAIGNQYANNAAAIDRNATESGFGANAPAGFTTQQQNQNAQGEANATGQAFTDLTTQQYQDALNNFWKSVGTTGTAMGQAQEGALAGYTNAANTYANLYKTAATSGPTLSYAIGPKGPSAGVSGIGI